jgi:hypothetical protein
MEACEAAKQQFENSFWFVLNLFVQKTQDARQ